MKLSEPRNEEFAKVTKKTVFVTNIYEHLPVDDTPLAEDDDEEEEPQLLLPQKRRKPAKTKKTVKTKKPQKPKPRPTVEAAPPASTTSTPAPKRIRNETNKVDDQLKRKHNVATISIGPSNPSSATILYSSRSWMIPLFTGKKRPTRLGRT